MTVSDIFTDNFTSSKGITNVCIVPCVTRFQVPQTPEKKITFHLMATISYCISSQPVWGVQHCWVKLINSRHPLERRYGVDKFQHFMVDCERLLFVAFVNFRPLFRIYSYEASAETNATLQSILKVKDGPLGVTAYILDSHNLAKITD